MLGRCAELIETFVSIWPVIFPQKMSKHQKNFALPDKKKLIKKTIHPTILKKIPDVYLIMFKLFNGYSYFSSYFSPLY